MPQVRLWSFGCAFVAAAGVLAAAAPASAQEEVTVTVTGEIEPSCGLSATELDVDLGTVTEETSADFSLTVDCNHPFTYELSSANGGLAHEGGIVFVGNFTELLPYSLAFALPVEDPPGTLGATCASAALEAPSPPCGSGSSGSSIAIGQTASFTVSWSTADHILLAGLYADELTFTVSVQP